MTDENHRPAATPATSADLMADVSKAAAAISTYLAYRHKREERVDVELAAWGIIRNDDPPPSAA